MLLGPLRDLLQAKIAEGLTPDQIAAIFSDEDVYAILDLYQAEQQRERFGKFEAMFPDETQVVGDATYFARHLYKQHMEFFRVGATYRERCFMAANRCCGPWSFIQTLEATVPVIEAWTSKDAHALSWVDGSECVAQFDDAYLKGIQPAYRLVMEDGAFFDCNRDHLLLTVDGWCSLDRLVSLSNGLRWWHKASDYQASCAADGCLGDGQLPWKKDNDPTPLPSQFCAQKHNLVWSIADVRERISECNLLLLHGGLQSTPDALRRLLDLCERFSGPSSSQPVLSLSGRIQALVRLASASCPHLQSVDGSLIEECGCQDRVSRLNGYLGEACTPTPAFWLHQSLPQSLDIQPLGRSVQELVDGVERMAIFFPSNHPRLVGDRSIIAVLPIGYQPIIDVTVHRTANYKAAGMYHHNTGKTFGGGGYEMACHLTGRYPAWWEGKRFRHPVRAWAAGKTNESTRDTVQNVLLGDVAFEGSRKIVDGSGIIPRDCINYGSGGLAWKQGVQDFVDTVKIKHVSGAWSKLGLKSYQQGRGSFEGTAQHAIWFDEEPPLDVYSEALIRTATTKGVIFLTFTPLAGLSEVVQNFLPAELRPASEKDLTPKMHWPV